MPDLNPASSGLILLIIGLSFFILVALVDRRWRRHGLPAKIQSSAESALAQHSDALLLIQSGGRIRYSNLDRLDWLNFSPAEIDLNILLQRIQPSHLFLQMCAAEGTAHLNIDHLPVEATATRLPYEAGCAMLLCMRRTQDLDRRVEERTAELSAEQERAKTLLRLSTELSASLDVDQILDRTLMILKEVTDATHITCLVWRPHEENLRHAASIGYQTMAPVKGEPSAIRKDQGLVGWIVQNKRPVIIKDLLEDPRWVHLPDTRLLHRSAIGLPLLVGDMLLGALFLFHPQASHFAEDKLDLVQAAANQVAVAINNAELYSLIREQADELSALLRSQQIETSQSRAILEAIAEGVLVTGPAGNVILFNQSAERILLLDRSQVLGKSLDELADLLGPVGQAWIDSMRRWASVPADCSLDLFHLDQLELDSGCVLSVSVAPVMYQKEFLGTVSIIHDITHQVEVDRLKSEFVATVSHELRTPLTSIKGYVEILLMGAAGSLNQQQQRFLEIARSNAERLAILVNDLLDLSRIEAGKTRLALQPLDLAPLAEEAIANFQKRSLDESKPIQFHLQLPVDLPRVCGDPDRVRQIVASLLENAFDYTPSNGTITLRACRVNGEVQVDVADNGIGIPQGEQNRVFERFYRGDHPLILARPGTGLGLNIARQLVSMHQGRIWLSSSGRPGEGSTFSFTLPADQPNPGQEG